VTQFVHQFSCSGTHVCQGRGTNINQAIDLFDKKAMLWDSTNEDYKNQQRNDALSYIAADLEIEKAEVENRMGGQSKEKDIIKVCRWTR